MLEKTLESPLDCKEIQPVHPEGDQAWVFFGRTNVEAEAPILSTPHEKSWLTGKDPDAGKDWRQKEKGMTEGEMVGWHHWLDGHEFEQAPGVDDGHRSLACCSSWGCKESDMTERLKWTEQNFLSLYHLFPTEKQTHISILDSLMTQSKQTNKHSFQECLLTTFSLHLYSRCSINIWYIKL